MSAVAVLRRRLEDVDVFLAGIRRIEHQEKRNKRQPANAGRLTASARASVYIMMYNAIEASVRESVMAIRSSIKDDNIDFDLATDFWRHDILRVKFLKKMQDGYSHGMIIKGAVEVSNSHLDWDDDQIMHLPFSGNFGQVAALRLKDDLALNWTVPANTLRGDDLENIRIRRNALAHGFDGFEETGNLVSADDLQSALGRVRIFMISYVEALERYRNDRSYARR